MRARPVAVQRLTPSAFAPFGSVIAPPRTPSGRSGEGWSAWYGFAAISCPRPLTFGYVTTEPRPVIVTEMERHPLTFEVLSPHDADLIQVVGPPTRLDDDAAQPLVAEAAAFLVPVRTSIVLAPGTWHSPAFPAGPQATTYTFACLEYDQPYDPAWVEFMDGATLVAE